MTSRRYLVQSSNGICNDGSLAALLTSACSPYQGLEESMMGNAAQKRPLYPIFETSEETVMEDDAGDEGGHQVEKKRRLSMEQVKSLEKNFELENKLEPERKLELAKELGLQPRQVAVWFQNRRARWKTKQLEKDYDILKSNFDALKADFEALNSEKDRLQAEVVRLKGKIRPAEEQGTEGVQDFASLDEPTTKIKPEIEELPLQHEKLASSSDQLSTNPLNNNSFFSFVCKKEACSSESEGSEILDIESPRQIDSGLSLQQNRGQNLLPEIQIDPCANNPAQLQIIDDSYRSAYQRIRLESQEDNCNIFPVLEDQAAISWWDW